MNDLEVAKVGDGNNESIAAKKAQLEMEILKANKTRARENARKAKIATKVQLSELGKVTPIVRPSDMPATMTPKEMSVSSGNKKQGIEHLEVAKKVVKIAGSVTLLGSIISFVKDKFMNIVSLMADDKKTGFEKFLAVWSLWGGKEKEEKEEEKLASSSVSNVNSESLESVKIPEKIKKEKEALVLKYNIESPEKEYFQIADISSKKLWIFNEGEIGFIPMNTSKKGIGFVKNSEKTPTGNFSVSVKKNTHGAKKSAGVNNQKNILGATMVLRGDDEKNKNTFSRNVLIHGWPVVGGNLSGSTGCIHVSGENAITIADNISRMKKKGKGVYLRIVV